MFHDKYYIGGFEYDIIISYRQKDNKYDGWVTDFVDNLKSSWKITVIITLMIVREISAPSNL